MSSTPSHSDLDIQTSLALISRQGWLSVIERCEFAVRMQPIVDLRTRGVIGFEALVRWKHPLFGLLSPQYFLKRLIQAGLIVELTQYVFDRVARFQSHVQSIGHLLVPVSVNVSATQIEQAEILATVQTVLYQYELPVNAIAIEMTETESVKDTAMTARCIKSLRLLGVDVYADDMGNGFAAVGNLMDYEFSGIKLDRQFISAIGHNIKGASVITRMTQLAKDLGMSLTAEGIEHEYQVLALLEMGVTRGQGYLFGKPMSRVEALEVLISSPKPILPAV